MVVMQSIAAFSLSGRFRWNRRVTTVRGRYTLRRNHTSTPTTLRVLRSSNPTETYMTHRETFGFCQTGGGPPPSSSLSPAGQLEGNVNRWARIWIHARGFEDPYTFPHAHLISLRSISRSYTTSVFKNSLHFFLHS